MDINRLPPAAHLPQPTSSTSSGTPSRPVSGSRPTGGMLGGLLQIGSRPSSRSIESEARAAIRKGDTARLHALLDASPQVALALDSSQDNLLGVAAKGGHADAVRLLLDYGAFLPGGEAALVNHRNAKGDTPLILAAAAGHHDVAVALLSAESIDVNAADNKGKTALHHAVGSASATIVGALLAHAAISPNIKDGKGDTALHAAIARDDGLSTELLLEVRGTAVNLGNAKGQSPLLLAVKTGKVQAARALLNDMRVDVGVLDDQQGDNLIHRMAAEGGFRPEWVTLLASHPALANRPNRQGKTPLQLAIANDQHAALAALLESDLVETERFDRRLRTPLQQALERIEETPAPHHLDRRVKTLRLLVNAPSVEPNVTFANGHTLLTQLCSMRSEPELRANHLASQTLSELLKRGDGRLDLNKPNANGQTPLRAAVGTTNTELIRTLLNDPRSDPNVLSGWLARSPERAYKLIHPYGKLPSGEDLGKFVDRTLLHWADKTDAAGKRHQMAYVSNAALGARLAAQERADAAAGLPQSADCSKGALFRLSLALEQCLDVQQYRRLAERSADLLAHAPAGIREFNLQGVEVSRTEIESWAAGKLPEGGVNRLIEARLAQAGLANVHNVGLTARGRLIMDAINARLGDGRLTQAQCIQGVRDAIEAATDADPEWRRKAGVGLDKALAHTNRVGEGLDVTVHEALALMWNHIESHALPASPEESAEAAAERQALRGALTRSLLENMVDMAAGYCDTGCVQRILYCVDGVDASLLPPEPTSDLIREEIGSIAGIVNNRFELLYGDSGKDLKSTDGASSSGDVPLSKAERKIIARYQGKRPIDDGIAVQIKQDMLEAAVMADLVERRGWRGTAVRPELERMKAFMNDA
ncbi:MAG TPA: ankyrin repeat domain-containing protein [Burkholderiaceae bacterium]